MNNEHAGGSRPGDNEASLPGDDSSATEVWDRLWVETQGVEDAMPLFARQFYERLAFWLRVYGGRPTRVLEPGCGTGRFCRALADAHPEWDVVGLDLSPESQKFFEGGGARPNFRFIMDDMFAMPFDSDSFDVVFNEGVIEHFEHAPSFNDAVSEMVRVLKPGGMMIVAVPNVRNVWHTRYKNRVGKRYEYGYEKSFSEEELRCVLETAGLTPFDTDGFDPPYGLERQAGRGRPRAVREAIALRRLGEPLDRMLGGCLRRRYGFEIAVAATKR
ncbi:MAG: class I SAM-dependent methyltransferase [Coriobacteriia bacterium]|nr:class I SAM-dependent methyltransferase [Coriobacteriia bacterium]